MKSEKYIEKKIIKDDSFILEHYSENIINKNEKNEDFIDTKNKKQSISRKH